MAVKSKKTKGKKNEIAPREDFAVDTTDYEQFDKDGFAGQSSDEITIPFLSVLQGLSPQVNKGQDKFIEGASSGDLVNSVTNAILPENLLFVPCHKFRQVLRWRKRDAGGGLVDRLAYDDPFVAECKAAAGTSFGKIPVVGDDTQELQEVFYVAGIAYPDGLEGDSFALIISFNSSKIKVYKKWNTAMSSCQVLAPSGRKVTPPLFAHAVRLSTVSETNARNESYFNLAINPANGDIKSSLLSPESEAFKAALELRPFFQSDDLKMDDESEAQADSSASETKDEVFA